MTMETSQYLERIERYLRPLPVAERVDIVAEIKSEMLELEAAGMPPQVAPRQRSWRGATWERPL